MLRFTRTVASHDLQFQSSRRMSPSWLRPLDPQKIGPNQHGPHDIYSAVDIASLFVRFSAERQARSSLFCGFQSLRKRKSRHVSLLKPPLGKGIDLISRSVSRVWSTSAIMKNDHAQETEPVFLETTEPGIRQSPYSLK